MTPEKDPRTRTPRDSMTLPVLLTTQTMRVYFSADHMGALMQRLGVAPYAHVCLIAVGNLVGIIPAEKIGDVAPHMTRCMAAIEPAHPDDPGEWVVWFSELPQDDLAPGLSYFEFHWGINGIVAILTENDEIATTKKQ